MKEFKNRTQESWNALWKKGREELTGIVIGLFNPTNKLYRLNGMTHHGETAETTIYKYSDFTPMPGKVIFGQRFFDDKVFVQ